MARLGLPPLWVGIGKGKASPPGATQEHTVPRQAAPASTSFFSFRATLDVQRGPGECCGNTRKYTEMCGNIRKLPGHLEGEETPREHPQGRELRALAAFLALIPPWHEGEGEGEGESEGKGESEGLELSGTL